MDKLIFIYYVFGTYTKYVPFCIYGILKSYPNTFVKVYIQGKMKPNEKESLKYIESNNYEIKENYFNNVGFNKNKISGGVGKVLRWIIPYEELKDFDYAYIGDIDMLIVKEEPNLLESHINHIGKIELPFSNGIRKCGTRLSGLHFIDIHKYYDKVNDYINRCISDITFLNQEVKDIDNNEKFLYNMIKKNIGFNEKIKTHKYRPHHGAHIGLFRSKNLNVRKKIQEIPPYIFDDNFNSILKLINVKEIIELKEYYKKYIR